MYWKRTVTVGATLFGTILIAAGPTWASGLMEGPLFNLTAPCPPGSISLIRRVGFLFQTPLRPCLLKPLLSVAPGLDSSQASPMSSAASTARVAGTAPSAPTAARPTNLIPQTAPRSPARAQPVPRPTTAHHVMPVIPHTQIPISSQTQLTPMAPVPSARTAMSSPTGQNTVGENSSVNYCPQSLHDQYVTTGPDGQVYPTWHPAVDPATGCVFGHEHGDDPSTCKANSAPPAFGYVAQMLGMTERHEGFKVFCLNSGDVADDGRTLQADYRGVFHMGTSGVNRYTEEFHSLVYDYVAQDGTGREAHIQGMADTGPASQDGSGCNVLGAKSFSTIGCDDTYEAWTGAVFQVIHPDDPFTGVTDTRATLTFSPAVFDPVLTRDPNDNSNVVYTQTYRGDPFYFGRGDGTQVNPLSMDAYYQGCQREAYGGPNYWNNAGRPTIYYTDAFGHVNPSGPDAMHPFPQYLSSTSSTTDEQYKIRNDHCVYGLHPPN